MNGVANQPLEGIAKIVRVTRTPLGMVALAFALPLILAFVALPFAPIPNIAKYVAGGVLTLFALTVWFQFWAKAKTDPLTASEEYQLAALRYKHLGITGRRLPEDEDFEKIQNRGLALPEQDDPEQDDEEGKSPP